MKRDQDIGTLTVIEEMRRRKKEYGFSYEEIAVKSGLPLGTVQKVLGGFTKSPRRVTIEALSRVLLPGKDMAAQGENGKNDKGGTKLQGALRRGNASNAGLYTQVLNENGSCADAGNQMVGEGAPAYNVRSDNSEGYDRDLRISGKRQGQFTIEDRDSIPEDRPSELIDGVIYNMASPTFRHQTIAGAIYRQLWNYVDSHGGNCVPFIAPTDVRLDRDDDTMLVPDVFVVCESDENKLGDDRYIDGAPDLVVEVLSPSTRKKDMFVKLDKYRNAGVREYWIVDPYKEKVIVYLFGEEPDVGIYGFDSMVPVGIYGGDCRINFTEIVGNLEKAQRVIGRLD